MRECHCRYLEPSFWGEDSPRVMHNPYSMDATSRLKSWIRHSDDPRLRRHIFFQTSGSSGKAKWVAISKAALVASAQSVNTHLGLTTGAKWALCLPIYHVGGFGVLVRSFLTGGHCQVFHKKWNAIGFSKFLYEHGSECVSLVPTQVADLVEARCVAPDSVKVVIVGGGKLDEAVHTEALNLGWPISQSYGMTEASSQIATGGGKWLDILDCWDLRISKTGELEWRGEPAMSYYLIENGDGYDYVDPMSDGWFHTEDIAELDSKGRVRVLGRSDSLVKVLGELVDLNELERKIRLQTGLECVVLAVADKRRGASLQPVIESQSVIEVAGFSGIHRLNAPLFVESFPRSPLGKIQRAKIRDSLDLKSK